MILFNEEPEKESLYWIQPVIEKGQGVTNKPPYLVKFLYSQAWNGELYGIFEIDKKQRKEIIEITNKKG